MDVDVPSEESVERDRNWRKDELARDVYASTLSLSQGESEERMRKRRRLSSLDAEEEELEVEPAQDGASVSGVRSSQVSEGLRKELNFLQDFCTQDLTRQADTRAQRQTELAVRHERVLDEAFMRRVRQLSSLDDGDDMQGLLELEEEQETLANEHVNELQLLYARQREELKAIVATHRNRRATCKRQWDRSSTAASSSGSSGSSSSSRNNNNALRRT